MSQSEILRVLRDRTTVTLCFQSTLPVESSAFPFRFECGAEWAACLLADKLRVALQREIEDIRQSEYERGYRDGRAKRAKASWFASSFAWRWVRQ